MTTLLIKNIKALVSCDSRDRLYENVDLFARDGFIEESRPLKPVKKCLSWPTSGRPNLPTPQDNTIR